MSSSSFEGLKPTKKSEAPKESDEFDSIEVMGYRIRLRSYGPSDEQALLDVWQRAWEPVMPEIDWVKKREAFTDYWRQEIAPKAEIIIAFFKEKNDDENIAGYATIDVQGYMDQLAIDPQFNGSELAAFLMNKVKARSPGGVTLKVNQANGRAVRFYEKQGFKVTGKDTSGAGLPVFVMHWEPTPGLDLAKGDL